MVKSKYLIQEEIRQMNRHKWFMSQKAGHDVGESAFFDWVYSCEKSFKQWADRIPEDCLNCGLNCQRDSTECIKPFDEHRINFLEEQT